MGIFKPGGGGSFTGTASRVVVTDSNGALSSSSITTTQLGYLSGQSLALPTLVVKAANQSRNTTTTYADDDTLFFSVEANKIYRVKLWIEYTLGAGGAKFQLAGPASTTVKSVTHTNIGGSNAHANNPQGTLPQVILNDSNTSGTNMILVECVVRTTNAGTLSLQWAQSTSNGANSTVLAGSHIEYTNLI